MIRVVNGIVSASTGIGYVVIGAAAVLGRALWDAAKTTVGSVEKKAAVRHTLRIVYDQTDMAQPFVGLGGTTHVIVLDPTTPHLETRLAHEFAHVVLAIVRGTAAHSLPGYPTDPAELLKSTMVHVEECAAWALAQAITRDSIWSRDALAHREQALRQYHVPRRLRSPKIPPLTRALVRWLAQVTP